MEIYDDKLETEFENLACILDENPNLCANPLENSSYLGVNLYTSAEGFQYTMLQPLYDNYTAYLDQFIKFNNVSTFGQTHFESTFRRLSAKYQNTHQRFKDSEKRREWIHLSQNFLIPNPDEDYIIEKQQKYTRWAYKFFWNMSATQLFFIDEIKQFIDQQLQPFNTKPDSTFITESIVQQLQTLNTIPESTNNTESIIQQSNSIQSVDESYHFSINPDASKKKHDILQCIFKHLKSNNYISCTLTEFKHIFFLNSPTPVVWHKDYIQLTYLIKKMSERFLNKPKSPSNYHIACKLFYKKEVGVYFTPRKVRHDKDPNSANKKLIDDIINDSIKFHMGY